MRCGAVVAPGIAPTMGVVAGDASAMWVVAPTMGVVAGDASAMWVVAAVMSCGFRHIAHQSARYGVDDGQTSRPCFRRNVAEAALRAGREMERAIPALGLNVNCSTLAVICERRHTAVAVAHALGASRPKGTFRSENLGADFASGRQRRWRATGSVFTDRVLKAARRSARVVGLRTQIGSKAGRLFATNVRRLLNTVRKSMGSVPRKSAGLGSM